MKAGLDDLAPLENYVERKDMSYRFKRDDARYNGFYDDTFNGNAYKHLCMKGLFNSRHDVAVDLFVDGFAPFKRSKHSATIVHVVNIILYPSIRYENKSMMQLCIIPGPSRPKDLWIFMNPIIAELQHLSNHGIVVHKGEKSYPLKVHLLAATGDIPAMASLMNHGGHMSTYGCRICLTRGERPQDRGRMFFPGRTRAPERTIRSLQTGDQVHRISSPTPFASLPSFHGISFFGLDEMHFLGHGIARQFFHLLNGKYDKRVEGPQQHDSTFRLATMTIESIGKTVEVSRKSIPVSFQGAWRNVAQDAGHLRALSLETLFEKMFEML